MNSIPYIIAIGAACAGFFVARHIYRTKRAEQKLVCPIGFECDPVVHSSFSHIMGIPLEVGGMLYYAVAGAGYAALWLFPALQTPLVLACAVWVPAAAFLFSLYLVAVQTFALKEWCTWCLASAGASVLIFATALWIFVL